MATAELLGLKATVFPSHHGVFLGGEFGYPGKPEAFPRRLLEGHGDAVESRPGGDTSATPNRRLVARGAQR